MEIKKHGHEDMVIRIACTCWYIWKVRCECVFELRKVDVMAAVKRVKFATEEYLNYKKTGLELRRDPGREMHWWDGVVRDENAKVLAISDKKFQAGCALVAVFIAFKIGIDLAIERKYHNVVFEPDSLELISVVAEKSKDRDWRVLALASDIKSLLGFIPSKKLSLSEKC
ncbi:hypothetical protein REPUB_Repub10bG0138000 [Reevesia pubescens]